MMKKLILISFVLILGCSESNYSELESYVRDTSEKPRGRIKPLPEFLPYSAFSYSASALRSPFKSPIAFEENIGHSLDSVEAPDLNRSKQTLEQYPLNELNLVGTLTNNIQGLKALIKTLSGSVHLLEQGQYIGKNNGRVINVAETKVDIIEIVPNGSGGWISRPQTMGINESSGENE
jgi:type IV pilus assembly protein PilP